MTLLLLVAWTARRYRRWGRDPASAPRGPVSIVRRVVLPTARTGLLTAVILGVARVIGETAPLIRGEIAITLLVRLIRLWPDVGLVIVLVNAIGLGWAVIGTVWVVRLLRRREAVTA